MGRTLAALILVVLLAGCGSKSASSPTISTVTVATTTTTSTSTSPSGSTTSTTTSVRPPAKQPKLTTVYGAAGRGPKTTTAVAVPAKWQLAWGWTCHGRRSTFTVTAHGGSAGTAKKLLQQVGIGGGGQRHFPVSGKFSLAVEAGPSCSWTLKIVK